MGIYGRNAETRPTPVASTSSPTIAPSSSATVELEQPAQKSTPPSRTSTPSDTSEHTENPEAQDT